MAGPQAISLLLADALYADGPLLAWLKYRKGIDAQVALAPGSSARHEPRSRTRRFSDGFAARPRVSSALAY